MPKINDRYPASAHKRVSDWLTNGFTGLDREMTQAETPPAAPSAEAAGQAEDAFQEKARRDRERESDLYARLHHWSVTRGERQARLLYRFLAVIVCGGIVFFLLRTVSALPALGRVDAPVNNEVSYRYISRGPEETGAVNFVSGMILDYRAFDTLGESSVLFLASCAVMMLLRLDRDDAKGPVPSPLSLTGGDLHGDDILRASSLVLFPVIALFGAAVVLNGHSSPGGGFAGGAILGGALMLLSNAAGEERVSRLITERRASLAIFTALLFYAGAKSVVFYTGANGIPLDIPLGEPFSILSAGLILPLDMCVGLIVALTMYGFYRLFTKGGY